MTDYAHKHLRSKPMKQPTTHTTHTAPTAFAFGLKHPRLGMLAAAAALLTTQALAQAQTAEPAAAASAPAQPTLVYYETKDLERAFKFMDKTGDGKVSRDEASNFRGVSKHFDEADVNKDNFLSREEFDNAMNKSLQNKAP